ncbi:MAG: STAS domain-containing protein [Acidobacteria bacterium]|nr:STAS domain-containing protein [Acidobacteriota bacterium]
MKTDLTVWGSSVGLERILSLHGELDIASVAKLTTAITGALDDGHRRIVLDCALLSFIDAAGLGAIVQASQAVEGHGGELVLRNLDGEPIVALAVTQLDRFLPIEDQHRRSIAS